MAYLVDRVAVCDAYREPDRHCEILPGGRSKLVEGRRPPKRHLVGGREARGGIAGAVGNTPELLEDEVAGNQTLNDFVNQLRGAHDAGFRRRLHPRSDAAAGCGG